MFWKKENTELDEYIMDLEDRVRNLKRRIHEANLKMGFVQDKPKRIEPKIYVRSDDPSRPDIDALKAKLTGRR